MPNILVVDDDETMRDSIQTILSLNGFDTLAAKDGLDALQILKEFRPELILCDVNMPFLDGYDVLKHVKQNPDTFHIPFVFLTVNSDSTNIRKGMNLGAEDYLVKPFITEDLLTTIEVQFQKRLKRQEVFNEQNKAFRDEVLSTIPHEFRTPLNGIVGFSELLKQSASEFSTEEIVHISSIISDSAERMMKTMKSYFNYLDILAMFNNDSFNTSHLTPFPLKKAIEKSLQSEFLDNNRKADIKIQFNEDLAFKIDADIAFILFSNVIENALKFSKAGQQVKISSKLLNEQTLQVNIFNEGRGLSELELQNISEFMQFDRKEYEQQGLGLGLVTVKKICQLYGILFKIISQKGSFADVCLIFENKQDKSE